MRNNQPVTQREYQYPAHQTLVSVTDRQGYITYCNPAFVEVSGYTEEELLGQPHNLVRHPDMPREAFRDLWATGAEGKLWSALVKNRRKDGDHYWVRAHVTPICGAGGAIVGFMSVRTQPSREEVAAAEKLYATMREEAAANRLLRRLDHGKLTYAGWRGWGQKAANLGIGAQLAVTNLSLLAATGALSVWSPWASLATVPVAAGVMWWQNRHLLQQPLRDIQKDLARMSSGDLSGSVTVNGQGIIGELQQALVQLLVNTKTVIQDVRTESASLHDTIEEIASGNRDLSSRTESAAASLEETAASIEQLNSTVQHSASTAQSGAQKSRQTADIAERSHSAVHAVAETMADITESSRRISDIIQLIEGVAFQTNILALNAAVEAARAGEQGRGFAVVASEVRSLAQRTSDAAREIKQLIVESAERVQAGSNRATEARTRMQEALGAVKNVATVLDEISHTSNEQRQGIVQVSDVISHLDTVTQQNAAMVEELSATAEAMRVKSSSVNNSMRVFRLRSTDASLAESGHRNPH